MKRFIVLFLILIVSIIGFASYPDTSDTYQDLSGGGFYDWIVIRSLFPDSSLLSVIGQNGNAFRAGHFDTIYTDYIAGWSPDSVFLNNDPDSLNGLAGTSYLTNVNDSFGILRGTSYFIDTIGSNALDSFIVLKDSHLKTNKSIQFMNSAGDTINALLQDNFFGLYDYANNITSVIGKQGFYKYNTAGDSGYFYLKDSSLTYYNYTSQIPVAKISVNSDGEGELLLQSASYKMGVYPYGLGIVNVAEDSAYVGLDTNGLSFHDYASQNVMASYAKTGIHLSPAAGGHYSIITEDTLYLSLGSPYKRFYNYGTSTFLIDSHLTMSGKLTALNGEFTNKLTAGDSIATNTLVADTIINLKLTSDNAEIDTIQSSGSDIIIKDSIKMDYKSSIKIGSPSDSAWVTLGYDYWTLNDVQMGVRSLTGSATLLKTDLAYIADVVTGWRMHLRPHGMYSYNWDLSKLWFEIDTLNYMWKADTFRFKGFTDSTKMVTFVNDSIIARVGNFTGYIYAKDSLKTAGELLADSIAARVGNFTGSIYTQGFKYRYGATDSIRITNDDAFFTGSVTVGDTLRIGNNPFYAIGSATTIGSVICGNVYVTTIYNNSTAPINIKFNNSVNSIIRWHFTNADNLTDTSMCEDSSLAANGTKGRMRIFRELTFKQPTFFDSLATFNNVKIGGGAVLSKFEPIGSHLAVIVGTDTFWVKTDSL